MLPCGCELTREGGFGDDGRGVRDVMEWCTLHRRAELLLRLLQLYRDRDPLFWALDAWPLDAMVDAVVTEINT